MNCFFERPLTVNSHDCDLNGVLSPSGTLRYLQEIANLHTENAGCGYDRLIADGRAFVLSRVAVDVHRPIRAYEKVIARTWPCESRGVTFFRSTQLLANGEPAAELTSIWALLHIADKSIVRVKDADYGLIEGEALELSAPLKFRIPQELPLAEAGRYKVGYSVCDRNMHMNNTRYPDMLCDFIPPLVGQRLSELSISFLAESHLGEELQVFAARDGGSGAYYFRTVRQSDGKTGVEARMTFLPL